MKTDTLLPPHKTKTDDQSSSFADRLAIALDKEGFPAKNYGRIQLLAELIGMTHRGVSKWLSGETAPPVKKYAFVAEKLNVSERWLRTGQGPIDRDVVFSTAAESRTVSIPVYELDTLNTSHKAVLRTISVCVPKTGNVFGIELTSQAMSPRFPLGTLVIFDDQRQAHDGDFVLINMDTYPTPIFRQLLALGNSFYLDAHNPKFDRLTLVDKQSIMGTAIQAIISL